VPKVLERSGDPPRCALAGQPRRPVSGEWLFQATSKAAGKSARATQAGLPLLHAGFRRDQISLEIRFGWDQPEIGVQLQRKPG
jgi:hypothetical protein